MFKRVLTSVIGLPLLILLVNIGGLPLIILLAFLSIVGLTEMYAAFSKKTKPIHFVGYIFTCAYYLFMYLFGASVWLLIVLTLFIIAAQSAMVLFYTRVPMADCVATVIGFFYVTFLLSFIFLVRDYNLGIYYVWLIFVSAFGCDTFAYFTGVIFGRHKLTGTPSPGKSVEGIAGGILGAALLGFLYGLFVSSVLGLTDEHIIIGSTIVTLFGAVFSIIGDMSASAIKRHTGIKDFGKLLPGHGGVLDRFDSVIITAPIVYLVMTALRWLAVRFI